jgi:hypothetical protein
MTRRSRSTSALNGWSAAASVRINSSVTWLLFDLYNKRLPSSSYKRGFSQERIAMIDSLLQHQNTGARCSFERPEHLSDHQASSRRRAIWWHYGRGDCERTMCAAYRWRGAYEFRLIVPARPDDVQRFASAVALLNRQATIERKLIADGWHLVRFTHQFEAREGLTHDG